MYLSLFSVSTCMFFCIYVCLVILISHNWFRLFFLAVAESSAGQGNRDLTRAYPYMAHYVSIVAFRLTVLTEDFIVLEYHRGFPIPFSSDLSPLNRGFLAVLHSFCEPHAVPQPRCDILGGMQGYVFLLLSPLRTSVIVSNVSAAAILNPCR